MLAPAPSLAAPARGHRTGASAARFESGRTGYRDHMRDDTTTTTGEPEPPSQPVIDLSGPDPIDQIRHPYSAAEHILDLAA